MWPVPASTSVAVSDSSIPDYFCKDGRIIHVGDCALFKPPQDSPPFIGIIRKFASRKEENIRLAVNWIYRPADVKLEKGILLEAAPNEVFYSFHKDEIPAASLLHPCKVAFLRRGVELPSGISSFVCKRVYDIENKCLWWLTDKDYINERQEEVDKLLDKTRLEMHGAVQSGGRSPKPLNGLLSTPQLKSGSDSVQNGNSSFSSLVKVKKRERGDPGSDPIKRERISKTDDEDSGQYRPENLLKSHIAKITDKGGLVDFEGVEKLIKLMQPESAEMKIDLAGRIMLVDVIAVTDRFDCLGRFVQLRGLLVLDEWLQEVHKGKFGEGSCPKESDKSVEEFLFALLRALDKLPVNLHALQTCNIGKSVNYLRSHKNSEIQKKSKTLVDTWKKRVEVEMNVIDAKSGSSRGVSWPSKPAPSEVSHVGSRKSGGSIEVGLKSSSIQPSAPKSPVVKLDLGEAVSKFPTASPGSTKSSFSIVGCNSKDLNSKIIIGAGTSDPPLTPIKEEKSSSSSQSQNNSQSCSGDHAKAVASSMREDARSSTAGSVTVTKLSSGASRPRKSSNGTIGSASAGVQKESGFGKASPLNRNVSFEKGSPNGPTHERVPDVPLNDHGNNQRLIVRLPNTGRSPARSSSLGSVQEPAATFSKASPSPTHSERQEHHDMKARGKGNFERDNIVSNAELCESKYGVAGSVEGNVSPTTAAPRDEQRRVGEECEKLKEASNPMLLSGTALKSGKSFEASFSSIDALIESCVKFSEASASASLGDDVGMNLLASVAAGEILKSDTDSPLDSGKNSPAPEHSCSGSEAELRQLDKDIVDGQSQQIGSAICDAILEKSKTVDFIQHKNGLQKSPMPASTSCSDDGNVSISCNEETRGECRAQVISSGIDRQQDADNPFSAPEGKHGEPIYDASVALPSVQDTKECCAEGEGEGSNNCHEQKTFSDMEGTNNVFDYMLNLKSPLDEKVNHVDNNVVNNGVVAAVEAVPKKVKVEMKANEAAPCSSFGMTGEVKNSDNESCGYKYEEQKPPFTMKSHLESVDENNKDAVLSYSGVALKMECMDEKANTVQGGGHTRQEEKPNKDSDSSVTEHSGYCAEENLDRKVHGSYSSGSAMHKESLEISVLETGQSVKSTGFKLGGVEADGTYEWHASSVNASSISAARSEMVVKLDFDLNEGFPIDDESQGEHVKYSVPGSSSAVHLSCPLPFPLSSISGSFPTSITVTAAAKGPFALPENLLRTKGELGWKGSAATSAFRPAEPRKVLEVPLNTTDTLYVDATTSKQCRLPFDIDLNVPDERILEDVASQNTAQKLYTDFSPRDHGAGGLDLDLNRVGECPDTMQYSGNSICKLENPSLLSRSSLSGGFSNGEVIMSRDFDLNNGPGLDEVGTETALLGQHAKSNVPFLSPVPGIRMNHAELGNFSSWFPPGNSCSGITIPLILPSRLEQSYPVVTASGSQRILGSPVGGTPFCSEMFRGPVLSSSPAVPFPPTTTFPYPGFPFETSFPLASNSFSGCSTAYMDSSSSGAHCFPAIPSQLVGPTSGVPPHYPRPYVMGLPSSTSGIGPGSRKWGNQGLDLNAGPGGTDRERKDERFSTALRQISVVGSPALDEEQLKMYQMAGGVVKRKEPDGGWDVATDRYKHP